MAQDHDYLHSTYAYYRFKPSEAAPIIFIVLFALTTCLHTYQTFRTRAWFTIPFVVGGTFEVVGYVGRTLSSREEPGYWTIGPFIVQAILLLVGPALFAATIYMFLGRIIQVVEGESLSLIRKRWLTKIFVLGDIISFAMQGSGGGTQADGTKDAMDNGENMIIGGLFVQIIFFACFVLTSTIFQLRLNKRERRNPQFSHIPWRRHLYTMYAASILILIRSTIRVLEYIQGNNGYVLRHEWFLYVFDASLMFLTMMLLNWNHPSEISSLLGGGKAVTHGVVLYSVPTLPIVQNGVALSLLPNGSISRSKMDVSRNGSSS